MKTWKTFILVSWLAGSLGLSAQAIAQETGETPDREFALRPIGHVEKPDGSGKTLLVLNKDVQPALLGLAGFSHVWVFWWFDKNDTPEKRAILQVHPRGNRDNPLTGVFATRSPVRPNLLALTLCRIVSITDNVVEIEKIDAFPGTPVLDLKPYIPGYDEPDDEETPRTPQWLGRERGSASSE